MATNKRPILIRVQPQNYEKLKTIADLNSRSISNQLEYLMIQYIREFEQEHGAIPLASDNDAGNKNTAILNNHQSGGFNNLSVNVNS